MQPIQQVTTWIRLGYTSALEFYTDSQSHLVSVRGVWRRGWSFHTVFLKLLFGAISLSCYPHLLPLLRLSVQTGAEAPKCCRGQARNPIHCQGSTVYWADIVRRFIWFPLSEVTELGEAQLLGLKTQKRSNPLINYLDFMLHQPQSMSVLRLCAYLYFSSGSEGHMACGIAIFSLLLRGLRPHKGGESSGKVAAEQSLLWRNI